MRFPASFCVAASILVVGDALANTSRERTGGTAVGQDPSPTKPPSFTPTGATSTSSGACASVSSIISASEDDEPTIAVSTALDCLKSVPLNVNRSVTFIEFIEPYVQFQSTLAYLKNPPTGWLFPGVDVLSGLTQIKTLLLSGGYKTQWDFEKDIWTLINILPHDFHFNLPLPLISSVFLFSIPKASLVSISSDGLSLPKVFFKVDLDQARNNATFTPSAVSKINDQDANMFLQKTGQTLSAYNDPDATYNQLFFSPAFNATGSGELYKFGQVLGFTSDFYNYTFENGTTSSFRNVATAKISFEGIDSGKALFDTINPPISTIAQSTTTTSTTTTTSAQVTTTTTSLIGYPTPVVMHRDGYTSGYFLPDSDVAVLAMQSFLDPADTDPDAPRIQSEVVTSFLSSCLKNNKTKLIVDVQGNGGGAVIEGYDVFQRIFPGLEIFGASRMRNSEVLKFFGDVYTASLKPEDDPDANGQFEAQTYLDVNGKPFANWSALDPPEKIYNDSFTAQTRFNLKYWANDMPRNGSLTLGPQIFESKNIVLLYDGSCGSTCAVFSEFMKSQGGVRSIVMGGRPQTGPMQGVAGSKGSEVLTFGQIDEYLAQIDEVIANLTLKSIPIPAAPPASSLPLGSALSWPLGNSTTQGTGSRFNFRNNMHQNDSSYTPLQYIYEASNCRLFYTKEDVYDIQGLWKRVVNTVWGDGKCVEGSTTTKDRSFPSGAGNTVGYSDAVDSRVILDPQPGLVSGSAGKGAPSSNNDASTPKRSYAALSNTTLPASISKATGTGSEGGPKSTSAGHNTTTNGTTVAPITGEAMVLGDSWWVSALVAVVVVMVV
ncbi:hypothetical protein EYC80_009589 [Monilinia laxa]|uniref:Uncharacterized protein n=1 Tax=Monilinia laxa TaxID=61186 RepID=A0A5N6JYC4_MONLA|nr:hypothetical protein EYC80_009589 [Monilinia laxa]